MTTAHRARRDENGHLSAEELSEAAEGLGGPTAGSVGHLRDCADCRDQLTVLTELLAELAQLPTLSAPPEVVLRIDAALAREARRAALEPAAALPVDNRRRSIRRTVSWGLGTLAAAAGLIVVCTIGLPHAGTDSTASSASGVTPHVAGSSATNETLSAPDATVADSALADLAGTLLAAAPASPRVNPQLTTTRSVPGCLPDPRFAGHTTVAQGLTSLGSQPVLLVLYTNGDDPSTVYAVAYAAPCTATARHVLDEGVVPR